VLQIIEQLKCSPVSVEQLAEQFSMNKRTVYRYLERLEDFGLVAARDFEGRICLLKSDGLKCCPDCGHIHNCVTPLQFNSNADSNKT
jgi:DNA-binding transcriptional ArsR family regulator